MFSQNKNPEYESLLKVLIEGEIRKEDIIRVLPIDFLSKTTGQWNNHEGKYGLFEMDLKSCEKTIESRLRALDVKLQYNKLSERIEISRDKAPFEDLEETHEKRLLSDMEQNTATLSLGKKKGNKYKVVHKRVTRDEWGVYGKAIAYRRKVNPFLVWLDSFYTNIKEPDKTLAQIIGQSFTYDCDDSIAYWGIASKLVECIQKQITPGFKHDWVTTLAGEKDIGKSTFWSCLFPENSRFFRSDINLSDSKKEIMEQVQGAVLCELSEMAGLKKAEYAFVKNFITNTSDTFRLPYRPDAVTKPRLFSLCSSVNGESVLPYDTGPERRFIMLPVKPVEGKEVKNSARYVRNLITANRNLIWNLAYNLQISGWKATIPEALKEKTLELADRYKIKNTALENIITDAIHDGGSGNKRVELRMEEVVRRVHDAKLTTGLKGIHLERTIASILREEGYKQKRVKRSGRKLTIWALLGDGDTQGPPF